MIFNYRQIKYIREKAYLTQNELAELIGVKKCSISRYEHGLRTPSIKTLNKIAKVTNNRLVIEILPENRKF